MVVFALLTVFEVIFIQWGMYSEKTHEAGQEVDKTTKILDSVAGQTTQFVAQMWLEHKNYSYSTVSFWVPSTSRSFSC